METTTITTQNNTNPTNLIREYLIKSHGMPGTFQQGAYTLRRENLYLDAFNGFDAAFNNLVARLKINPDDYSDAINTMYKFFYESEIKDVKKIAARLNRLKNKSANDLETVKTQLITFFNDVIEIKTRPNFTPYKLRILFERDLGVSFIKKDLRPKIIIHA